MDCLFLTSKHFQKLIKILVSPVNSFMTEAIILQKPVHWFDLQINGLVSIW